MKLVIPEIGSELKLIKPWTFSLFWESRNTSMFDYLYEFGFFDIKNLTETLEQVNCSYSHSKHPELAKIILEYLVTNYRNPNKTRYCYKLTLPEDTILKISRYYIRHGCSNFSSITFTARNKSLFKTKKPRFWAKLYEINSHLEYEPV